MSLIKIPVVKVIKDSVVERKGIQSRLTTLQLQYPRIIHCFHPDTEFLSQVNDEFPMWRSYDAVVALGAKVAQFDNGVLSFVYPTDSIKRPETELVVHKRKTFEMAVSPKHRMYSLRRTTGNEFLPHVDLAEDWLEGYSACRRIPQAALLSEKDRNSLPPDECALIAFYVADGHKPVVGDQVQFHFKKQRKVDYVLGLLEVLGITHIVKRYGDDVVIRFTPPSWVSDCYTDAGEKQYPSVVWNMSSAAYKQFRLAVLLSDGNVDGEDINTTSVTAANQLQIILALNNEAMNIRSYSQNGEKRMYKQSIQKKQYVSFRPDKNWFDKVAYFGDVVCFSVPSSFLFVRYNGFAYVSGNCELMTHRTFSRNASSSRAIPIAKIIEQVRNTPAAPYIWTTNKPGMQGDPVTDPMLISKYDLAWVKAANSAADNAEILMAEGLHKQVVNRIMEPYQLMHTIVTATEWDNFFSLRCHSDADPTIEALANAMRKAMAESKPTLLNTGEWHLPYITVAEKATFPIDVLVKASAARCARVSYLNHDGSNPDIDKDLALYYRLVGSVPLHASPVEHMARGAELDEINTGLNGNFSPLWVQYRKLIELGVTSLN